MEAIQIIEIGFDNMENNSGNAIQERLLGTFIEGDGLTAHGKADKFIHEMKPIGHYLGWDNEIYPKLIIKKIQIT